MSINILSYGSRPTPESDTTPFVREAIRDIAAGRAQKLVFPKGRYHFWPDRAVEEYLFISNNDESLKRIAFALTGLSDIEIDGEGSEFVFHGYIIPFALQNCRNITLSNFTMDWERTFLSESTILDFIAGSGKNGVLDIRIPTQFPYEIAHEQLRFVLEGDKIECLGHVLEFDPVRRETAYKVHDNGVVGRRYTATDLGDRIVRIEGKFHRPLTPGNTLMMTGGMRYCPGIALMDCEDISIADVTIHHCGGMGVIGQRTRNVDILRLNVTPNVAEGRMISASADAIHFVNCAGQITISDCLLENQMDDSVNVHGIYARISDIMSSNSIEVELVHPQQRGIDITQAGDTVEFVANQNLMTYHEAKVLSFERLNKQFYRLRLDPPLPKTLKTGDGVASLGWIPNLTVTNTVSRGNRARGFLVSTAGKVVIEGNHFHTPGSAILIAGDSNYWFESGKVRDVTIRNNHFDNCLYGVWGDAVISISPEIAIENRAGTVYHKSLVIESNRFDVLDRRLLSARCVDGLVFRNNVVNASCDYPPVSGEQIPFSIDNCTNLELQPLDCIIEPSTFDLAEKAK